jgi:competence protein ComEC
VPLLAVAAVALALGVALADALRPAAGLAAAVAGLAAVPALWLCWRGRAVRPAALLAALAVAAGAAGALAGTLAWRPPAVWRDLGPLVDGPDAATCAGTVIDLPDHLPDRTRITLELTAAGAGGRLRPVRGRLLVTVPGSVAVLPGDRLRLEARLRRPAGAHNPGGFDHERYLRAHGIDLVAFVPDATGIVVLAGPARAPVLRPIGSLRERLRHFLAVRLGGEARGLMIALVLGDRGHVSQALDDDFRAAGVTHVLSVSGLHLAVAAFLCYAGLKRLLLLVPGLALRLEVRRVAALSAIPAVVFYTLLTGAAVATVRSAIMAIALFGAAAAGRSADHANAVGAAGIVILLWSPLSLFDPSFQLTFAAVIALAATAPLGARAAARVPGEGRGAAALKWAARFGVASTAALLATAPIAAIHFNQVAPAGLLGNFLVVPLAEMLVLPLGLGATLLAPFWPALAALGVRLAGIGADLMAWASHTVAHLAPSWRVPAPTMLELACTYGALGLALVRGRRWARRGALACAAVLALSVAASAVAPRLERRLRVTFLDVGDADCALVELPGGEAMLIDAAGNMDGSGSFDPGEVLVAPALRARRVGRLARVIVTHPHPDHIGGLPHLLGEGLVGEVWDTGDYDENPAQERLRDALARRGVPRRRARDLAAAGVELHVLHPRGEPDPGGKVNDNSLVLRLRYAGRTVLLLGDAEAAAEDALLALGPAALRADVVKVGHHGSRTSSGPALVAAAAPAVAVISASPRSRHGFPHPEVVERWRGAGARVLTTGQDGAITVTIDARGRLAVETARGGSVRDATARGPGR